MPAREVIEERAHAKINLTLEVLGRRPDGYHEILSVVQAVEMHDLLNFSPDSDVILFSSSANLLTPGNLVLRAIDLVKTRAGTARGVAVKLEKAIPEAAGLGGGSSDAAATLRGLDRLWGLGMTDARRTELSGLLGSDVVFFSTGASTCLMEGRGEKVSVLRPLPRSYVVLLKPPLQIPDKTRTMYSLLGPSLYTRGEPTRSVMDMVAKGDSLSQACCYNVFEPVAFSRYPVLREYKQHLLTAGAEVVGLAGSGPTLYTMTPDRERAEYINRQVQKKKLTSYLTHTL